MYKEIIQEAEKLGLRVDVSAPGEGYLRYKFCSPVPGGRTFYTALGASEATAFLRGFRVALEEWERALREVYKREAR